MEIEAAHEVMGQLIRLVVAHSAKAHVDRDSSSC
jgi:hypothetical protein